MYVFIQTLHHNQDVTHGQFLIGVKLVWIQSFSSLRLVTKARESSLPYNLLIAEGISMNNTLILFPIIITIM